MFRRTRQPLISKPELLPVAALGRVLCVSPHPDDETLGCGGTLAAAAAAGAQVHVVLLSAGEREPGPAARDPSMLAMQRLSEFAAALQALGVHGFDFLNGRDTELAADAGRLSEALAGVVARTQPDTVLLPSPTDAHRDHRSAAAIAVEAVARTGLRPSLLAYEVWAPVGASHVVDITAVLPAKRAALDCYALRFRSHDLDQAILGLNRYRAQAALLPRDSFAEAFAIVPPAAV